MAKKKVKTTKWVKFGGVKILTNEIQIPALTVEDVVSVVSGVMAEPGEEPSRYLPQARRVLTALYQLKAVGRSNLLSPLHPPSGLKMDDILSLIEHAGVEYVYVAANAQGNFKVGRSNDPDVRMRNLSTGAAGRVRKVLSIRCGGGRVSDVESAAHKLLAGKRISPDGEWFNCTEVEAREAVNSAWHSVYGDSPKADDAPESSSNSAPVNSTSRQKRT